MTSSHWGDLTPQADADFGIAVLERDQLIKPRTMDVEGPRLYQPSSQHHPPSLKPTDHVMLIDPYIKHTIELSKYAAKLRKMITFVQQHYANSENTGELNFPPTPELPSFQKPESKLERSAPLPFVYRDVDKPCEELRVVQLDDYQCRRVTRRAVAMLMAHVGLETCAFSIVEAMTDLCTDFITKMATSLRKAKDNESLNGFSGFPDIITNVFHENGLGEVTKINDFYQERVIGYHDHMIINCTKLRDKYEQVKNPEYRNTTEFKTANLKEEVMSDITFPTFTEEESQQFDKETLNNLGLDVEDVVVQDESKWIKAEQKCEYEDVSDQEVIKGSPTPDLEVVNDSGGMGTAVMGVGGHPAAKVRKID